MSHWGLFVIDCATREPHIAPVNEHGMLRAPHVLSRRCHCQPKLLDKCAWVHHDPQLGGTRDGRPLSS